jgi:hypothetical protein
MNNYSINISHGADGSFVHCAKTLRQSTSRSRFVGQHLCRCIIICFLLFSAAFLQAETLIDLTSDTAWTLRCDDGPARPIKVPGGGWNSDQQSPRIQVLQDVKDFVVYERKISVPQVMPEQAIELRFGAVTYGCEVFLDGKKVGEHHGPQVAFEMDLKPFATPGKEQTLQVKAFHRRHYLALDKTLATWPHGMESLRKDAEIPVGWDYPEGGDAATRKEAAYWSQWHGQSKIACGIVRSVKLAVLPAVSVKEFFIRPSVTKKQLSCDVWLRNATDKERKLKLNAALSSWNKRDWKYPQISAVEVTVPAKSVVKTTLGPVAWNLGPESYWWPNIPFREDYVAQLHFLNLKITEGSRVWEQFPQRFGFVEHAEGPFYYTVNGVRVTGFSDATAEGQMSYYDTYSSSAFLPPTKPGTGAPESWRRYLRAGININRLHCSPPTEYMMEAADEVGFMLIPEAPIWQSGLSIYSPKYMPQCMHDLGRACRNHPCVARYSLANEVSYEWPHTGVNVEFFDVHQSAKVPWLPLIDDMWEADQTHPMIFDLGTFFSSKVFGPNTGAHAWTAEHYSDIRAQGGGEIIRSMGECCTFTGEMGGYAVSARTMRMKDWAYMSPWSWINYWPNFLEGMNRARHPWQASYHDRRDGFDGWNSPPLRFLQRSLDPYLVQDHDILANNPGAPRGEAQGKAEWPYQVPTVIAGRVTERNVELFNGGLTGNQFSLAWSAHWDKADGPIALAGGVVGPFTVEPGFHVTQKINFAVPAPGQDERRLYLVMNSLKYGQPVFVEDGVYLNVLAKKPATAARFLGVDDTTQGDWKGKYGTDGYELEVKESKLPAYAKFEWQSGGLWTWSSATASKSGLEYFSDPPKADARLAAARFGDPLVFQLDIGNTPRRLSIYHLDYDKKSRRQSVEITDALTGDLLDKGEISDFTEGRYQSWQVSGKVRVTIRKIAGPNANISGIFLDPFDKQ